MRRAPIHAARLGAVTPAIPATLVATQQADVNVTAFSMLFTGLFSATSLIMFATGHERAGYMMGVAGALLGGVFGALQLIGGNKA